MLALLNDLYSADYFESFSCVKMGVRCSANATWQCGCGRQTCQRYGDVLDGRVEVNVFTEYIRGLQPMGASIRQVYAQHRGTGTEQSLVPQTDSKLLLAFEPGRPWSGSSQSVATDISIRWSSRQQATVQDTVQWVGRVQCEQLWQHGWYP